MSSNHLPRSCQRLSRACTSFLRTFLRTFSEDARGPGYSVFAAAAVASASPQVGDLAPSPQLRGR